MSVAHRKVRPREMQRESRSLSSLAPTAKAWARARPFRALTSPSATRKRLAKTSLVAQSRAFLLVPILFYARMRKAQLRPLRAVCGGKRSQEAGRSRSSSSVQARPFRISLHRKQISATMRKSVSHSRRGGLTIWKRPMALR